MKFSKFVILAGTLAFFAGCSSSTPSVPAPAVNYQQGQNYKYYAQQLDKNSGDTVAGSGDTITSVVLATGISYQGMNGVTEIQNTHTNPIIGSPSMDTSYIAQSNGNYYHYNYGFESINENSFVIAQIGSVQVGWVLQAELSAGPGTTWSALNTSISAKGATGQVVDTATEQVDSTLFQSSGAPVNASGNIFTKHSKHNILVTVVNAPFGGGMTDTYVSSQYGPVLDIIHPSTIDQMRAPGLRTVLIQVP